MDNIIYIAKNPYIHLEFYVDDSITNKVYNNIKKEKAFR